MQVKPERDTMAALKFSQGDKVIIATDSITAPAHAGERGVVDRYFGVLPIKLVGQEESGQTDPWWNIQLANGGHIAVQESELTPIR